MHMYIYIYKHYIYIISIQKQQNRHCFLSLLPPSFALPLLAEARFPLRFQCSNYVVLSTQMKMRWTLKSGWLCLDLWYPDADQTTCSAQFCPCTFDTHIIQVVLRTRKHESSSARWIVLPLLNIVNQSMTTKPASKVRKTPCSPMTRKQYEIIHVETHWECSRMHLWFTICFLGFSIDIFFVDPIAVQSESLPICYLFIVDEPSLMVSQHQIFLGSGQLIV